MLLAKIKKTKDLYRFDHKEFSEKYTDDDHKKNIILSENCMISCEKDGYNNNVLVIGGPGMGKTHNVLEPNLRQLDGSYIISDPLGYIMSSTKDYFEKNGYAVKILNISELNNSSFYNPLKYITKDNVENFVNRFIIYTKDLEAKTTQRNAKAEEEVLKDILLYAMDNIDEKDRTFYSVLKLIRSVSHKESTDEKLNAIFDKYDDDLKDEVMSILILKLSQLCRMTKESDESDIDEIDFNELIEKPTVVYATFSPGIKLFNFTSEIFFSQALHAIKMLSDEKREFKQRVHFMLDEFPNIGVLDVNDLITDNKMVSVMIFIQAIPQLKALYGHEWKKVVDACDTIVYIGGNELHTIKMLPEMIGEEVINSGEAYIKKENISESEIRCLDGKCCIIKFKNEPPFIEKKYNK